MNALKTIWLVWASAISFVPLAATFAQESESEPRATPTTRPVLKQWLESVKQRTPRIPLPELSDDDRQKLGEQADDYETRLRFHYLNGIEASRPILPSAARAAGRIREQDPNFTLDSAFKVELFWIVSRVNNCHYCIGHQETKLLAAGKSEDDIAALDGDWSKQPPEKQAAFRFARRLTYEPHLLSDADIRELKTYYSDAQVIEMVLSMCGNNSINRWKEAVAVPQRADEGGYSRAPADAFSATAAAELPRGSYLTATSPQFDSVSSLTVPINGPINFVKKTAATASRRSVLESGELVLKQISDARRRNPRVALMGAEDTLAALPKAAVFGDELPNWVRVLAPFPVAGAARLESFLTAENGGDISPILKGQLAWIVARQDRAWYATGQAMRRLKELGLSESDILSLDGNWDNYSPRERALFQLARNLAASPVVLTTAQVAESVAQAGPRDTVQAISYVCSRASFNRLTEALGLPLE